MSELIFNKECRNCGYPFSNEKVQLQISSLLVSDNTVPVQAINNFAVKYHAKNRIKCIKCGSENMWIFEKFSGSDFKINHSNEGIRIALPSGEIVYFSNDVFFVANNSVSKLKLNLNVVEYEKTAWQINLTLTIIILQSYFEVNLIPDKQFYKYIIDTFSKGSGFNFTYNMFRDNMSIILNWEAKSFFPEFGNKVENYPDYKNFLKILYPNIKAQDLDEKFYSQFVIEYLKTKQFLFYFINKLFPDFLVMSSEAKKRQQGLQAIMNKLV